VPARVEDLRTIPLFAELEDEALEQLAAAASEVEVPAGQLLIQPGAAGSGMFFVVEGAVEVEARETVRELGPGDFCGELALLTEDGTRTARVSAKTDVRCVAFDRSAFEELVRVHPDIAATLLETALTRLD
jgi:CPA2 family monovalent cation:H+ antiporter-2